jgi:CheY-like chemotaxis protein
MRELRTPGPYRGALPLAARRSFGNYAKCQSRVAATSLYLNIRNFGRDKPMHSPAPVEKNRLKVLIADDEQTIARTLRAILKQSGYAAVAAYDGQCALATAIIWHPDIFLSDVAMPRMNGIEAATLIRMLLPACRVLLISGNIDTAGLLKRASAEGHGFPILHKPVHPEELLERLGEVIAG